MSKRLHAIEERLTACCKDVEEIDRVALRALRMAERIRSAVGQQRRDMMARLEELRLRVEAIERQRR